MVKIQDISKDNAIEFQSLIKELRPDWNIDITEEDINLYKLGFIDYIPCSLELNVNRDDIVDLLEEIDELETWAYLDEEILYKKTLGLTEDEKRRKQVAVECLNKYERYECLQGILSMI
ncbi:MAG: hypothetical protein MR355_05700 [Lachnospiraceae bacterium]|nr:hypothetical protein [Lachnospiraceae bacterium]